MAAPAPYFRGQIAVRLLGMPFSEFVELRRKDADSDGKVAYVRELPFIV